MSYRFRAILIITAVFTLLAPASAALATDNTTPWYKKGRQYYLLYPRWISCGRLETGSPRGR